MAVGALAGDVAVGQELAGLLVVELHGSLLDKLALVVEAAEKLRCRLRVQLRGGAGVYVKRYAQPGHRVADDGVVAVDDVLWGDTLGLGLDGDGHAMLVAAADHQHLAAAHTQVAGVDVCGDVDAGQMAYVHRAVGVRQRGGYEGTVGSLFHICLYCCKDTTFFNPLTNRI